MKRLITHAAQFALLPIVWAGFLTILVCVAWSEGEDRAVRFGDWLGGNR